MTRDTCFIAAPADIRSEIVENQGVGLILVNQLKIPRKIILLFVSVWAFSTGIVKPDIKNITILGEQFGQLIAEIIVIFRRTIILGIPVPGGKIKPEFDTAAFTCLSSFFHN